MQYTPKCVTKNNCLKINLRYPGNLGCFAYLVCRRTRSAYSVHSVSGDSAITRAEPLAVFPRPRAASRRVATDSSRGPIHHGTMHRQRAAKSHRIQPKNELDRLGPRTTRRSLVWRVQWQLPTVAVALTVAWCLILNTFQNYVKDKCNHEEKLIEDLIYKLI